MCNKEIKFGYFLKFALKNGADFVATGHYAQKNEFLKAPSSKLQALSYLLKEGADKNKDQSYFLWTLAQKQLKHIFFPIGHLQKSEVRKLAKKFNLPQATRKDSQGLCFLGQIDMKEFLKEYAGVSQGKVLNEKREVIGEHDGAILYTMGERHGFTVTKKSDKAAPLYVVSKDIDDNTITVAPKHFGRSSKMLSKGVELEDINLIGEIKNKEKLLCRIRYRQQKVGCKVNPVKYAKVDHEARKIKIVFDEPQFGVSAGQSLVLYSDEICLGGGIIS